MKLDGENEIVRHPLGQGRTLVWRDEGSPYDNHLHVVVLAADGAVLDAVEAGAAMTTGVLEIRGVQADLVDFGFFSNEQTYRLTVEGSPSLRLPLSLPTGFRYKHTLARHILSITTL